MGQRPDEVENFAYNDMTTVDDTTPTDQFAGRNDIDPRGVYPSGVTDTAGYSEVVVESYATDSADLGAEDGNEVESTRQQIEQTRSDMSQTIDAIQDKLSPANMAQGAKDAVYDATIGKAQGVMNSAGDSAADLGSGIIDTVKQNPIPAALAAIGIGWLIVGGRKNTSYSNSTNVSGRFRPGDSYTPGYGPGYDNRYGQYGPEYGSEYRQEPQRSAQSGGLGGAAQQAGSAMSSVAGQVQETAGQVQNAAGQAVSQVQGTAGQVAGQVQDTAGQLTNQAQYGMRQAQSGFQQMMQENPLAVAAGALALGVAVGLTIPETPQENQWMGPMRDQLVDQAQQTVQEKTQQVQEAAQQAVGAAQDAAQNALDQQTSSQ